ncbi:MAG: PEP-CTERM sorting domain-containing protein [Gammaproteobacteria bacterium]
MNKLIQSLSLLCVLAAPSASAVVIFQDDFNGSNRNTVGNGWAEIEDQHNDVGVTDGVMRLRDTQAGIDAAATQSGFSTIGLTDIMLSYDGGASYNTEGADSLFVEWRVSGSSTWNELIEHALGGSALTSNVLAFGIAAANQASIDFRFYTSVSATSERALIDNVVLTGRTAAMAVSEPTTLALLGVALFGIGLRRRQSRSR